MTILYSLSRQIIRFTFSVVLLLPAYASQVWALTAISTTAKIEAMMVFESLESRTLKQDTTKTDTTRDTTKPVTPRRPATKTDTTKTQTPKSQKTIPIDFWPINNDSVIVLGKQDSVVLAKNWPDDQKSKKALIGERKAVLLKIIGARAGDSIAKALQHSLGFKETDADGYLGEKTIDKLADTLATGAGKKAIELKDAKFGITFVFTHQERTPPPSPIGWLLDNRVLHFGHVHNLNLIDSLRLMKISYGPAAGQIMDSIKFSFTDRRFHAFAFQFIDTSDAQNPKRTAFQLSRDRNDSKIFLLQEISSASMEATPRLYPGSPLQFQAFLHRHDIGTYADTTIALSFCFLPDGQIGFLASQMAREKIRPYRPLEQIILAIVGGIISLGVIGLFVYRGNQKRKKLAAEAKRQILANFRNSCEDLFSGIEFNDSSGQTQEGQPATAPPTSTWNRFSKLLSKIWRKNTPPTNKKNNLNINVERLKDELAKKLQEAWQIRKKELADLVVKEAVEDLRYRKLLDGVENLSKQRIQIQERTLELLKAQHFLFGEISPEIENVLKKGEQEAWETLRNHLDTFRMSLETLQKQIGQENTTWSTVCKAVTKRLQVRDQAEQKLREIAERGVPLLFEQPQDQVSSSHDQISASNGRDLMALLDALEQWSIQYNQKRKEESEVTINKIEDQLRQYALLFGITEIEERLERFQDFFQEEL